METIIERAAYIMDISKESAKEHSLKIKGTDAMYFKKPVRGGVQVIVDKKGGVLLAPAIVKQKKMIEDYKEGKRSA